MSRHKATGEKATATKPERKHVKAVDRAIKEPTTANRERCDKTFKHLHRQSERFNSADWRRR
jgi:hypothetical protein